MIAKAAKSLVRQCLRGVILRFGDAIGDDLLCTAVARELRRRENRRIWIVSRWPELFRGNHDFNGVLSPDGSWESLMRKVAGYERYHLLRYEKIDVQRDVAIPPTEHLIAVLCRSVGLAGTVQLRPYVHLSSQEIALGSRYRDFIVVQSSGAAARIAIPNKWWPAERFAQVADQLLLRHRVVQIGSDSDPSVPCTVDLRGKTSLRQLGAVLANARLFVGLVGAPMHMARAVDCPAVVVYGGREAPWQSGYACNENLYLQLPCSPCWAYARCDYERRCLSEISVEQTLAAVEVALSRPRDGLPCESVEIK